MQPDHVDTASHSITAELNEKTIGSAFSAAQNPTFDEVSIGVYSTAYAAVTAVAKVDLSDFQVGP